MDIRTPILSDQAVSLLACPVCRGAFRVADASINCTACGRVVPVRDGVVLSRELTGGSYFDSIFEVMRISNQEVGTWELFYRRQAEFVSRSIGSGDVVVDVGCGPQLPYEKGGAFVVGVDASVESIQANSAVDLRIFASASDMPLRNACADVVVCFYSIHHMTGGTVSQNRAIVAQVFREFARVLKPTGRLLVFDVNPRWPFGALENISWNAARRVIGSGLDMYFWDDRRLESMGREIFRSPKYSVTRYAGSSTMTFPPIFSKPHLRLPRLLYPFHISLHEWQLGGL